MLRLSALISIRGRGGPEMAPETTTARLDNIMAEELQCWLPVARRLLLHQAGSKGQVDARGRKVLGGGD